MAQLIKRIFNLVFTSCCRIRGGKVGLGSSISYKTDITNCQNIKLGNNSSIYKNVTIYSGKKGTFKLGHNSHIAPYGYFLIGENSIEIGNDVAIGPFCSFFCVSNSVKGKSDLFRENYIQGDIYIGNNVFIGAQCVILPGAKINDNTVIAANSVINGVLESGYIYGGSPAKKIKKIES